MSDFKVKPSSWFDTIKKCEVFGIQVKHGEAWMPAGEAWMHAGDDNGVLLFNSKAERDEKIVELRRNGIGAKGKGDE